MAGFDDDLKTLLEALNRNISRIGGSTTANTTQKGALGTAAASLNKAVNSMTGSFRLLHGTTDDLAYSIKKLLSFVAGGELLGAMIDVGRHFVRTYNQLSDVGQLFNGSLSQMMAQAGEAGLSLDEYAKSITRNSALAAVMNVNQETTGRSLIDLQKGVRSTLKEMGFYGMTLSEVTDVVGDSLEMYRQSGVLYQMNAVEQKHAIASLVEDVTAFSQVTGKSRQEILKGIKQMAEETGASGALALSGKTAVEAYQKWNASLLQMDPQLAQAYSKAIVTKNIYLTSEGMDMVMAGMGDTAAMLQGLVDKTLAGMDPTLDEMSNFGKRLRDEANQHLTQLQGLAGRDPGVTKYITMIGKLNSIPFDQVLAQIKKQEDYLKNHPVDRYLLTFESQFHDMVGAFQSGFYKSFVNALMPANANDEDAFNKNLEKLKTTLADLGTGLGNLVISVGKVVTWWWQMWQKMGVGGGWGLLISAALFKVAKTFASLFFQRVIIKATTAQLMTGGAGSGGVPVPGTGATASLTRGRQLGGAIGGTAGAIGGLVLGDLLDQALKPIIDSMVSPDSTVTKGLIEAAIDASGAGLGALGGRLLGQMAGSLYAKVAAGAAASLAGGVVQGGLVAVATAGWPLLVAAAIAAAVAGGIWYFHSKADERDKELGITPEQRAKINADKLRAVKTGHGADFHDPADEPRQDQKPWFNLRTKEGREASNAWTNAHTPITPDAARIPFTDRSDIEAMKKRIDDDRKRVEEEKAKEDAANPNRNTLLLKDIADTNKEMTELQACVAALVKKNNDLTQEGNRQQASVAQCG